MPSVSAQQAVSGANQRKLERWFAENLNGEHPPVMSQIPLGLNGPGWWDGPGHMPPNLPDRSDFQAPILRRKLVAFLSGTLPRDKCVLVAFNEKSNPGERSNAAKAAAAAGYNMSIGVAVAEWPATLQAHLFVISPPGNGVDTHRMWEAVLNGAIPIVRQGVYESWLSCLPYVAVASWSEITDDLLHAAATKILDALDSRSFDFRRTLLNFHAGRIGRAAARAAEKCTPESRIAAAAARAADETDAKVRAKAS